MYIKFHFRFWGIRAEHAGLLHTYIHDNVVCCLHPPSPISGISPHVIPPQPPYPLLSLPYSCRQTLVCDIPLPMFICSHCSKPA